MRSSDNANIREAPKTRAAELQSFTPKTRALELAELHSDDAKFRRRELQSFTLKTRSSEDASFRASDLHPDDGSFGIFKASPRKREAPTTEASALQSFTELHPDDAKLRRWELQITSELQNFTPQTRSLEVASCTTFRASP
eukprot:s1130_g31.t1